MTRATTSVQILLLDIHGLTTTVFIHQSVFGIYDEQYDLTFDDEPMRHYTEVNGQPVIVQLAGEHVYFRTMLAPVDYSKFRID
ncbi:hypothetical protein S40288_11545 [Stachybotrys chartarum IBT 40288]|nr:hypothetical protein S40288_11545 [Stachybotrys chartarum IBT 40288]